MRTFNQKVNQVPLGHRKWICLKQSQYYLLEMWYVSALKFSYFKRSSKYISCWNSTGCFHWSHFTSKMGEEPRKLPYWRGKKNTFFFVVLIKNPTAIFGIVPFAFLMGVNDRYCGFLIFIGKLGMSLSKHSQ